MNLLDLLCDEVNLSLEIVCGVFDGLESDQTQNINKTQKKARTGCTLQYLIKGMDVQYRNYSRIKHTFFIDKYKTVTYLFSIITSSNFNINSFQILQSAWNIHLRQKVKDKSKIRDHYGMYISFDWHIRLLSL